MHTYAHIHTQNTYTYTRTYTHTYIRIHTHIHIHTHIYIHIHTSIHIHTYTYTYTTYAYTTYAYTHTHTHTHIHQSIPPPPRPSIADFGAKTNLTRTPVCSWRNHLPATAAPYRPRILSKKNLKKNSSLFVAQPFASHSGSGKPTYMYICADCGTLISR